MKVAVISFSGNVGKTTISRHLLAPRMRGAKVISIKHLADAVVQKIDASNSSFWAAKNESTAGDDSLRLMERQRLSMWLQHAYEELAKAEA